MAVTPASPRSLRNLASSAAVLSVLARGDDPPEPPDPGGTNPPRPPSRPAAGSTGELSTMVPAPRAASAAVTPPGRAAMTLASPPPGGSSHRAAVSADTPSWLAPGSGRLDVNSSDPSGRNRGLASPSADRVSRRAGPPPGSTRHRLVRYFFPSALSVCTAAASQSPSGDNRRAVTRGIAANSVRSWNGVVVLSPSAAASALTVAPVQRRQPAIRTIPLPRYPLPGRKA